MRFPRALAIRDDLAVEDCLTASALFESIQSAKKRKTADSGDGQKKRKGNKQKPIVLPQYQGAEVKGVDVMSSIFEDMKFQVTPDPKSPTAKQEKNELEILIFSNGGDYSQLPRKDTSLIVYGGDTTPPSIASIIKKGQLDIIRPKWIKDSVARKERLPLKKRYFFHATEARQLEDDYWLQDSDADDATDTSTGDPLQEGSTEPEENGRHNEWLDVPENQESTQAAGDNREAPEEDTIDNDSDNLDIQDDDTELSHTDDLNEKATLHDDVTQHPNISPSKIQERQGVDVTMGDESAMNYDQDLIFKHLCFYLDTADNARRNNLLVDDNRKWHSEIERSLQDVQNDIINHGGVIADLEDPKLTHVLYDKRDESRRIQLLRRTSKSKRRHVIMTEWASSSIAEGGLLDEAHFS